MDKTSDKIEEVNSQIQEMRDNLPSSEDDEECQSYEDCDTCTKSLKCGWCI